MNETTKEKLARQFPSTLGYLVSKEVWENTCVLWRADSFEEEQKQFKQQMKIMPIIIVGGFILGALIHEIV